MKGIVIGNGASLKKLSDVDLTKYDWIIVCIDVDQPIHVPQSAFVYSSILGDKEQAYINAGGNRLLYGTYFKSIDGIVTSNQAEHDMIDSIEILFTSAVHPALGAINVLAKSGCDHIDTIGVDFEDSELEAIRGTLTDKQIKRYIEIGVKCITRQHKFNLNYLFDCGNNWKHIIENN